MPDDERYRVIGKLVIDHEQSKRDLTALETKAKNMAPTFRAILGALAGYGDWTAEGTKFTYTETGHAQINGTVPSLDDAVALLGQIAAIKVLTRDLEQQRKKLGV